MTPLPDRRGRNAYKRSARGRRRGGRPAARHVAPIRFEGRHFRVTVRRPRGGLKLAPLNIDIATSELTWARRGAGMTGTLTFNWPEDRRNVSNLVAKTDIVRLEVQARDGAPWRPLWEMTVTRARPEIAGKRIVVELRSRLKPAQQSRRQWRFRDDRQHPRGWTADEITRSAARRFRVPLGPLPKGQHRIRKLVDKSASVLQVTAQAWATERRWTGRRFDVSIARGRLEVRELRRPRYMLLVAPLLIDAVIDDALPKGFATALVLTATVRKRGNAKRRKLRARVVDRARIRRYGYIVRHVEVDDIDTIAELRRHGKRLLARHEAPLKSATLTLPGIPWADRGDGVRLTIPQAAIDSDVFLVGVEHRLGYGSYDMDCEVVVADPWRADERAARVRRRKAEARRRRARPGERAGGRRKAPKAGRRG